MQDAFRLCFLLFIFLVFVCRTIGQAFSRHLEDINAVFDLPRHPSSQPGLFAYGGYDAEPILASISPLLYRKAVDDTSYKDSTVLGVAINHRLVLHRRYAPYFAHWLNAFLVRCNLPRAYPAVPACCKNEIGKRNSSKRSHVSRKPGTGLY